MGFNITPHSGYSLYFDRSDNKYHSFSVIYFGIGIVLEMVSHMIGLVVLVEVSS